MRKKLLSPDPTPAELRQAEQFIREICLLYRKDGADEDCIMDGWAGFWQARQTYGRKQGRYPFWEYAFLCIREQILDTLAEKNRRKNCESPFSLDQPLQEGETADGHALFPAQGDFVNSIVLYDFVDSLNVDEQMVARAYIRQDTEEEIKEDFHLSSFVLESIREDIRRKLEQYLQI